MDKKVLDSIVNCDANDVTLENANINAVVPSGIMMKFASLTAKEYAHDYLLSDEARKAVDDNLIHVHDLDYYPTRSLTCLQHPLNKVLEGGFQASDGTARPCKRIETAQALAAISIQTVTNEQHGGQSIPAFDFYMAPYVRATYEEELAKTCEDAFADYNELIKEPVNEYEITDCDHPKCVAINRTVKRVHQSMEAFIHNMNTMRSRGGGQVPFSSINYGTDTSAEGRLIIRELLKSTYEGVGNGQTAIFPIQIWKLKKGVSAEQGDPNYDLLQLACEVTAKRFFPNFVNLDTPFNYNELWDANDPERYKYEVVTMGCRTRVFENRHGEKSSIGRGNLSFTTINLPRLALLSGGNYAKFLELLEETVDIGVRQLVNRYKFQCEAVKKQFPMLMSGLWLYSEKLQTSDTKVEDVLKHGTLSLGFIGLAECLIVLTGKHHGESDKSQLIGLDIIKEMYYRCKYWADYYDLNISVIATPAEGLAGKFVPKDREDFGVIENVTNRDYYTNSNHIPVWYKCTMEHKLKTEAVYHPYTPAGHIAYVEFDGDAAKNPQSVMDFIELMREYNVGYGSVNHTRSRCLDCGYENAEADLKVCPECGSENIDTIQRITGYLVGTTSRWNSGKKAELKDRVTHTN